MSIEWDFQLNLDQIKADVAEKVPAALLKGMQHVRQVSAELVPQRDGDLLGSAEVVVVGYQATLSYDGPYALYQHEGVYYRHGKVGAPLKHEGKGESFYLERPMVSEADTVLQIVADELLGDL